MFIVDQKCPSFHQSESLDGSESEFPVGVVEETPSSTQESFYLDYNPTVAPVNFKWSRNGNEFEFCLWCVDEHYVCKS